MGNYQSNYPERMLKLKNFKDLNNDIDEFNQKFLTQKSMDALGFLIQFDEINYGGVKGIFRQVFFQKAIQKMEINASMLFDNKPYFFKLKINEMYTLAELLNRYSEDAEKDGIDNNDQQNESHNKNSQQNNNLEEQKNEEEQKDNIKKEKQQQKESEEEDALCPLCLDQRIKIVLPCYHGYCDNCAKEWIQEKNQKNCPMCRREVEATKSRFNIAVMHVEDDVNDVNDLVKQQILQIILSKNNKVPFKNNGKQSVQSEQHELAQQSE